MKLHLTQVSAWTGLLYDLQIESGTALFSGSDDYRDQFPGRFKLREESERQIEGVVELLSVFDWRARYRPEDVGSIVDDGGSWSLVVVVGDRSVESCGENAFPSYRSSADTALDEERLGLLRCGIFAALRLSVPFGFSSENQRAEQAMRGNGRSAPSLNPESGAAVPPL